MTPLRKKMIGPMQLRGLAETTQQSYLRRVDASANHYQRPPDQLTKEEIHEYARPSRPRPPGDTSMRRASRLW